MAVAAIATSTWRGKAAVDSRAVVRLGAVRQDHNGRWYLDLRPHGRIFKYLARWGEEEPIPDQRSAEKLLEHVRDLCQDGLTVPQAIERIRPRKGSLVLTKAVEWVAVKQAQADAGRKQQRSVRYIRDAIKREWGYWDGKSIHEIKASEIEDWATVLSKKPLAPNSVRTEIARLHAFLAWLLSREDVSRIPPFPEVVVPKIVRPVLTFEQQDKVLAEIAEEHRGAFLAMAELALRPQEARPLLSVDVSRERVLIRLAAKDQGKSAPVGGTKTGIERELPTTPRLWAWWEQYGRRHRLAFPSPRGSMWGQNQLAREWKRASLAAGVPYVTLRNATRHSTAQEWRRRGFGISDIRDALGHTNEATTRKSYLGDAVGELVDMVSRRKK